MKEVDLTAIDWAVILTYLAGVVAIGVIAGRRVRHTNQYFLGDRNFNKWIMIGQSFGTGTHAEMPVSLAGAVYTVGASGIWFQWKNLFATPFYWLFAPLVRRMRRTTMAEVVEDRYGPWMGAIYTVFALCFFIINMASMLKGAAKVINQVTGGHIPVNEIVVLMTVVFVLYSMIGGLVATAWTDVVQGFLILALSFLLIPLGWDLVGGMEGMRTTLEPFRFSLSTPQGIGPWFISMLTINGLIGIIAQPHVLAAVGTGKTEHACRVGFLYGTYTKRFCTIGWVMVGLMVSAMTAQGLFGVTELRDPEDAFGYACRQLLFPGGVGLLVASLLAANMAACSAFMVDSSALFTRNIYKRYFRLNAADTHYLRTGRLSGLVITLLGVGYAVFLIDRVLYSFLLTETMATFVGISMLGGIIWPRANRWGALASMVVAFTVNFATTAALGHRLDHWSPNIFLAATLSGVAALIVVSLVTTPESGERLKAFYRNLQKPADDGASRTGGHQLLIPNLLDLRGGAAGKPFLEAYREDLRGFLIGGALALAMLAVAWLVLNL